MKKLFAATCICILSAVISMAIYGISEKYSEQSVPTIVTLSSDQLEGVDYTEATKFDDSGLWEDGDETYSYSKKPDTETGLSVNFPIDINTATAEELTNINGIGISTAEKIISYRENNGYFHSIDELINVEDIGEKTLDKMREFIYVDDKFAAETTVAAEEITETVSTINFPIDINTATAEELTNIKGIGISTAEKIISYRENNGYFHSIDELINVEDIGEKTLDKMREFIYVDDKFAAETTIVTEEITETVSTINFPIDINTATAEELKNIKGIGISTAEKIISYRENNGYFHSVDELINVNGIGEKKLENIREYVYVSPEFTAEITETTIASEEITETVLTYNIELIELNSATKEELMQISGIGEVTAGAIVEYAQTIGFNEVSDLLNIKGIGENKLEKIAPYVYVEK